MTHRRPTSRSLGPATWSAAVLVAIVVIHFGVENPLHATPQDNSEEMILQYGPDLNMFESRGIESVLQGWKWQLEVSELQQKLVSESVALWEANLMESQQRIDQLQRDLAEAGVPSSLDRSAISAIHQAIRANKGELSGMEAKLKELKLKAMDVNVALEVDRNSLRREVDLMQQKMQLLSKELARTIKLQERGLVSNQQIVQLENQVAEANAAVQRAREQLKLVESRLANGGNADLVGVTERMRTLAINLNELSQQKEIIERIRPLQQMQHLEREIDLATRMLEVAHMKQLELQLESTRNRALILLTEKRLAEAGKKSEATSKKDDD